MDFKPGDMVTIQYVDKSGFEADEVPNEAMDRICEVVDVTDGDWIVLRFPYAVKLRNGQLTQQLTIPQNHSRYQLRKERVIDQREASVDELWEQYWYGKWGKRVSDWLMNGGGFKDLELAIKQEGLRAPVLLHRDGTLRGGSHRVLVYKRMGRKTIDAFVTDTTGGTL
jgi:hypothetical protein